MQQNKLITDTTLAFVCSPTFPFKKASKSLKTKFLQKILRAKIYLLKHVFSTCYILRRTNLFVLAQLTHKEIESQLCE